MSGGGGVPAAGVGAPGDEPPPPQAVSDDARTRHSPPSWEVYVNPVAEAVSKAPSAAPAHESAAHEAGFNLKGVVSVSSANQMAELNDYAASRSEIVIEMGKVLRVDFGFTAAFFDVVKAIQLAGKRVILANLNELNAALLEAMGVNRYAILVRRKSS